MHILCAIRNRAKSLGTFHCMQVLAKLEEMKSIVQNVRDPYSRQTRLTLTQMIRKKAAENKRISAELKTVQVPEGGRGGSGGGREGGREGGKEGGGGGVHHPGVYRHLGSKPPLSAPHAAAC